MQKDTTKESWLDTVPIIGKYNQLKKITDMKLARKKANDAKKVGKLDKLEKKAISVNCCFFHTIMSNIIAIIFGLISYISINGDKSYNYLLKGVIFLLIFSIGCLGFDLFLSRKAIRGAGYVLLAIDEIKSNDLEDVG